MRVEYQNVQVFTYGVSEQQQLEVLDGGDGTVSNQLHQSCRQRLPLKHKRTCESVSCWTVSQHSYGKKRTRPFLSTYATVRTAIFKISQASYMRQHKLTDSS